MATLETENEGSGVVDIAAVPQGKICTVVRGSFIGHRFLQHAMGAIDLTDQGNVIAPGFAMLVIIEPVGFKATLTQT